MKSILSLLFFSTLLFSVDLKINLENSNILGYQKELGTADYNRLRLTLDLYHDSWEDISAKLILDNENIYSFKEHHNQNKSRFYRGYLQYSGQKHMLTLGLQRVPFGVGRIWNPIDVFNPIDITSIETAERKGTEALRYEYAINSLSSLDITLANKKQAFRVKGYLDVADVALVLVKDEKREIIGYEIEGDLKDVTLRSEGGYFSDTDSYRYILGAEYGFENSLTVLMEFYHDSYLSTEQLALNLSYQYSPLLYMNFLTLGKFDNSSCLISPSCIYSLSDESSITMGAFIGDKELANQFFMRYFINF